MALDGDYVDFKAILSVLQDLQRQGQSGLLNLETPEGHDAFFGLSSGKIVAVRYRKIKRGERALADMQKIQRARYSFDPTTEVEADPEHIQVGDALYDAFDFSPQAETAQPTPEVRAAPSLFSRPPTAQEQTQILNLFTHYMGPMAQFVFDDILPKSPDFQTLIFLLGREITDRQQAAEFEAAALDLMNQ